MTNLSARNNSKRAHLNLCELAFIAIAMALSAGHSLAGVDTWTPLSPEGGVIQAIAIDPNASTTVYVGTARSGVFKSVDGGAAWTAVNSGITDPNTPVNLDIQALAIDPLNSAVIYAGTNGGGMFKSVDAGATWLTINTGFTNLNVYDIAIHPAFPNIVYAATFGNLFKSIDAGQSWTRIGMPTGSGNTNISHNAVYSVHIEGAALPETVYVGTHAGGPFGSTNGGITWISLNSGNDLITPDGAIYSVKSITTDSLGNLYIATLGYGLLTSNDNGANWTELDNTLFTDPDRAGKPPFFAAQSLEIDANDVLYTGMETGLFFGDGTTWTEGATQSGGNLDTLAIAIDPNDNQVRYAGTTQGLYKTTDGGTTWAATNTGILNFDVTNIAVHSVNPAIQYATTMGSGVVKTTDSGTNWTYLTDYTTDLDTLTVAIDTSTTPETVYVGTVKSGLLKSGDGGATWAVSTAITKTVSNIAVDPVTPTTVYAGGQFDGVIVTTDGGGNWSKVMSGITDTDQWSGGSTDEIDIDALTIDPTSPNVLYMALTGSGLYTGGYDAADTPQNTTWTQTSAGLANKFIYTIAVDPTNSSILYAGTRGGGAFQSTDAGANWTEINNGLTDLRVNSIVVDPSAPSTIYAGTQHAGAFKTTDSGATWFAINTGLTDLTINALTLNTATTPPTLYAGTSKDGILEIQSTTTAANNPTQPAGRNSSAPASSASNSGGGGIIALDVLLALFGSIFALKLAQRVRIETEKELLHSPIRR